MASTFTLTSHSYGSRYMYLECSQSKDIATNKSTISWKLSSLGGEVNYYASRVILTINGSQEYDSGYKSWESKEFPAAKGSTNGTYIVDHDAYGNKSFWVQIDVMIYDGVLRAYGDTWTLDNIPRQAELTYAPDFTDNQNPTIKYKNPAGNSVDGLYACISWTGGADIAYRAIDKTGATETLSYTFPLTDAERDALRNAAPTGKRDVTFYVTTDIGGNRYYSTSIKKLTIEETENTKPAVSLNVTQDNSSLPSVFEGIWVQGKSRADISVTAQGKYSASISTLAVQVGSAVYNSASFKTNVIEGVGEVDIVASAKDTRGFTGTASEKIDVIEYSKPLVIPIGSENAIQCYRSDGNGKRVGSSTSLWIKAKRFYHSVNGLNQCSLQWRRKLSTDVWDDGTHLWTDLISKATTNTDEYNALLQGIEFELRKSYTVQIRAIDDVGEYDRKEFDIPTQDVALHLGKGGKNVTVGTYCDYSEDYTFRSIWKAIFDEGFVDGTDTGWIALNNYTSYRCKCGYVTVVVWSDGSLTLTPNAYTEIGTLPKEHCPEFNIPFTYHTQGSAPPSQSAYIGPDGKILLYTTNDYTAYFAFSVTYPI